MLDASFLDRMPASAYLLRDRTPGPPSVVPQDVVHLTQVNWLQAALPAHASPGRPHRCGKGRNGIRFRREEVVRDGLDVNVGLQERRAENVTEDEPDIRLPDHRKGVKSRVRRPPLVRLFGLRVSWEGQGHLLESLPSLRGDAAANQEHGVDHPTIQVATLVLPLIENQRSVS